MSGTGWMAQARCRGAPVVVFFPDDRSIERARATCALCAVTDACLDYAMRRREPHGIWGGLTSHERAALRRKTQDAPTDEVGTSCGDS